MTDANYTDVPGVGAVPGNVEEPPVVSFGEMARLTPGAKFVARDDSTKTVRERPQQLTITKDQYAELPEGAQFIADDDPEKTLRTKPTYEGIGFTAQTLYDMAINDKERKKALEFEYPGKVKEDAEGHYIDDGGKLRRPGRGIEKVTGFLGSAAAPTAGAVLGAIGGGAAGGPAAFATGMAGGAGGAMLGQTFNDVILGLAGIRDREGIEQFAATGEAGLSAMMGAGVGRGISTVVPSLKAGVSAASNAAPGLARWALGSKGEDLQRGLDLAEKGVMVPPSAHMHEAPHFQNIAEVFHQAFDTSKPYERSATQYYEKEAKDILHQLGVERTESVVSPTANIPTKAAGERIMQRTLGEQAEADEALRSALEKRSVELSTGMPEKVAQRESVLRAAEESRNAAQKLIDVGFKNIEGDVDAAFKVSKAGAYGGDLWEHVGNKLRAIRQGISTRAKYWYDRYDEMTDGASVSSQELSSSARSMIEELPAEFKARNPGLVQKLEKLGTQHGEDGELLKEAEQLTYGQLHDLRSLFRGSADWTTLSSDFKNGSLKRFSDEIDRLIHDPEAPAHVQAAARFLDMTDKWYAKNIKIFNASQIKAVMRGLEAGEPADPAALYNAIVKEGHSDLIERVKQMVGPNLWSGVKAADTKAMLDAAKTLEPGVIDGRKFASEVLQREQSNLLRAVHGADSAKLLSQARSIQQLAGTLPIPAHASDTMTQVIARAKQAEAIAKEAAKRDPLGQLTKEARKVETQLANWDKGARARARGMRSNEPLAFLHDPTTGGIDAVDKILRSEDLILAAAAKFGEQSTEFGLLRQIYAQRILQATLEPGKKLAGISPEIQQLMFPGATLEQMQTLAKNMDFLMNTRAFHTGGAGSSMSAFAKVEHPAALGIGTAAGFYLGGPVGAAVALPLTAAGHAGARIVLGKFYSLATKLATNPATFRWLQKGLNGSPEEREAVKVFTDKVLQKGTAVGAGAAEATFQGGTQ